MLSHRRLIARKKKYCSNEIIVSEREIRCLLIHLLLSSSISTLCTLNVSPFPWIIFVKFFLFSIGIERGAVMFVQKLKHRENIVH